MRILLALFLASAAASAAVLPPPDVAACLSPMCGGFQTALDAALAERGLTDLDGVMLRQDARGGTWLTLVSTNAGALDAIAPRSGATTLAIDGTRSFVRTVPITLDGIDTIRVPGGGGTGLDPIFIEFDDIDGESGGGGGGSSDGCEEVCVCTAGGVECWLVCSS